MGNKLNTMNCICNGQKEEDEIVTPENPKKKCAIKIQSKFRKHQAVAMKDELILEKRNDFSIVFLTQNEFEKHINQAMLDTLETLKQSLTIKGDYCSVHLHKIQPVEIAKNEYYDGQWTSEG